MPALEDTTLRLIFGGVADETAGTDRCPGITGNHGRIIPAQHGGVVAGVGNMAGKAHHHIASGRHSAAGGGWHRDSGYWCLQAVYGVGCIFPA